MSIVRLRIHEGHPSGRSMCPHLVERIAAASDTVGGDTEQSADVARLPGSDWVPAGA
ncbi:hypothetical protein [Brachybacterium sp. ACRRE]|uniref:hypothetical protein n=1 Tax=Brachybacterium sp. ACRRE TaxID=2918184 RepID=UPI001EF23768|nr:hypothetical protein [Brachybacterium sp. ACRRE]MCG7310733.1 hypothetical protein [Brachybacterium sp. ACRRE]